MGQLGFIKRMGKREKLLLAALVIVVGGSLIYRAVGQGFPSRQNKAKGALQKVMDDKAKASSDLEEARAQDRAQQKELADLQKNYDNTLKEIASYEEKIPAAGSITQLLGEITRRSEGLGMDFESIRQNIEREKEGYLRLKLDMKFSGPYSGVVNYLNRLNNLSDYLSVFDIEISQTKEGAPRAKTNMELSMLLLEKGMDLTIKEKETPPTPLVLKIDPFVSKKPENKDRSKEFKLSGITGAGKESTAIINDEVVRTGAKLGEWQVIQIVSDAVTLSNGIETVTVTLNR
ncbi:MAG: type 4a pilus biogenesis protein PilO [Candidatus Omnitrophica bacterium]|nr:type 4a pilus biogenesis protein PilO [Candidatus Omnitrophota bacterium]